MNTGRPVSTGDHAKNDMAGPDGDSWLSVLTAAGFEVVPALEGLGAKDDFFKESVRRRL